MFCHNCGAKLEGSELFCPECGTPVEQGASGVDSGRDFQGDQMSGGKRGSRQNWDGERTYQYTQEELEYQELEDHRELERFQETDAYQEPEEYGWEERRRRRREEQQKKRQRITLALLSAAIVVLVGGVCFGVWTLMKMEEEDPYEAPEVVSADGEDEDKEDGGKGGRDKDADQDEGRVTVIASPTPTEEPTPEPTPTLAPVTVVTATPTPTPAAAGGDYIFPDSNSRYLSYEEVAAKGQQELVYARNEIFARHGRKFKSAELQAYFSGKSWYVPVYEPDEFGTDLQNRLFNSYEKENIKQISRVEQDKGYTS